MKASTKDRMEGSYHRVKGAIKEKTGSAINNLDLEARGQDEKTVGKIQSKIGQAEKILEK